MPYELDWLPALVSMAILWCVRQQILLIISGRNTMRRYRDDSGYTARDVHLHQIAPHLPGPLFGSLSSRTLILYCKRENLCNGRPLR
jgi:hypothetical protein